MPNENIMGIPTKACINGITKADSLEIKKIPTLESETDEIKNETIPALDDRITALEESQTSGTDWVSVDYRTQTSSSFASNFFNYASSGRYFTKDVKIHYHLFNSSSGYDVYLFFPKGSKFSSFGVNFTKTLTDSNNIIHYFVGTRYYENTTKIMELGDDDGRVYYYENGIEILNDNGSLTFRYVNKQSYTEYTNIPITFWYRR